MHVWCSSRPFSSTRTISRAVHGAEIAWPAWPDGVSRVRQYGLEPAVLCIIQYKIQYTYNTRKINCVTPLGGREGWTSLPLRVK